MKQKYLAIATLVLLTIYMHAEAETPASSPLTIQPTQSNALPQTPSNPSQTVPQFRPGVPRAPNQNNPRPNPNPSASQTDNNSIQSTGAEGGKRMTVIDANGNLKMVETPPPAANTAPSNTQNSTSPGMNSSAPTTPTTPLPAPTQSVTPSPSDSSTMTNKPQTASPPMPQSGAATPSAPAGIEPPLPLNNAPSDTNLNNTNQPVP